jgi:hypothetical protein
MNHQNATVIITVISLLLVALGLTPFLSSTQATISASEDSETSSVKPDYKFGYGINIAHVATVPSANELHYFFLKFDLSDLPAGSQITDVKLNTYCEYVGTAGFYEVTYALSNVWTEYTLTWNSQPQLAGGAADSKYIDAAGWKQWSLGAYSTYVNEHLKTDMKVTFVLVPDRDVPTQETTTIWRTREYSVWDGTAWTHPFSPYITLSYGALSYKLTVLVNDTAGNPIQGVAVTSPFTAATDTYGQVSLAVAAGDYTVSAEYQGITYTQTVRMDMDRTVTITVPIYTLTVVVTDAQGNPISGATVLKPVSGFTDARGIFTADLRAGTYTVAVSKDTIQASENVTLTSAKTVSLHLISQYTLDFMVQDQCGNPLPARVTFENETLIADKYGRTTQVKMAKPQITVTAEVKVGTQTYSTTQTFTVTTSMTKTLTITRRFLWKFFINYTDGTLATGKIIAVISQENVTIQVVGGNGTGYLLDGTYTLAFEASPAVTLKPLTISNDGEYTATINKQEGTSTSTSTETPSGETPPSAPTTPWALIWSLISSPYIQVFLVIFGLLIFIILALVIIRLWRRTK